MRWPTESVTSDALAVFLLKKHFVKGIVQPPECSVKSWCVALKPADLEPATLPQYFVAVPGDSSPRMRCLRSVLSVAEAQSAPASPSTGNPDKVPCAAAHAHGRSSPSAALKAAQVPLRSPGPDVTRRHHEFILKKRPHWASSMDSVIFFLFWVHTVFYLFSSLR